MSLSHAAEWTTHEKAAVWKRILRLPSVETQLIEWVSVMSGSEVDGLRSLWLRRKGFHVYVRWARKAIDGREATSLDLANIEIPIGARGRGWFKNFIALMKAISPREGVYIEAAANPANFWMHDALLRWGFVEVGEGSKNYWCQAERR